MSVNLSLNPGRTRASIVFQHHPGNLLTAEIVAQLHAALADLDDLSHLRLVTIEGAGPDFSFGASIPEHAPEAIATALPATHALLAALLDVPAPTAAVVRGRCLGGGFELALACDFIIAADTATFGLPEIALGVFPPAASVLLPLRAGASRSTSAILSGDSRPAAYWQTLGVVETVLTAADLSAGVDDWYGRTLERRSAEALRHAARAARTPVLEAVTNQLPRVEQLYLQDLMRSHDAVEGIRAFLERRQPDWQDK
jgi:cyclohexa-1,5-dienecarbonyl-CoA hydratase